MKDWLKLICCIIGCELVGLAGTIFTFDSIPTWYATLIKPFFSPPNWIFGPVWTTLYFLMGVSLYLILEKGLNKKEVKIAVKVFFIQLVLNFLWTPIFFGLKSPLLGLITIVAMWAAIAFTMIKFYPLSRIAAYLLIPYLAWASFATVLNGAIVMLN